MKKVFLSLAVVAVLTVVSCKKADAAATDNVDSTAVAVDSAAAVVDSAAAVVDSAAAVVDSTAEEVKDAAKK